MVGGHDGQPVFPENFDSNHAAFGVIRDLLRSELARLRSEITEDLRQAFPKGTEDDLVAASFTSKTGEKTAWEEKEASEQRVRSKTSSQQRVFSPVPKLHRSTTKRDFEGDPWSLDDGSGKKPGLMKSFTLAALNEDGEGAAASSLRGAKTKGWSRFGRGNKISPSSCAEGDEGDEGTNSKASDAFTIPKNVPISDSLSKTATSLEIGADAESEDSDLRPSRSGSMKLPAHKSRNSADAGMGLTSMTAREKKQIEEAMAEKSLTRMLAQKIISNFYFELFIMSLICMNSVLVGVQTQYMATNRLEQPPEPYRVMDLLYLTICTLEVALRLYAHRLQFFYMWGWVWNMFDMVVVGGQLLEEMLLLLVGSSLDGLNVFSLIRILRALRVVRVLRVLQHASNLRLLVSCVLYSVKPLFWSAVLIGAMTYVTAIYFTQSVTATLTSLEGTGQEDSSDAQALSELFGSLTISALSLFQGIAGGIDWKDLVNPLMNLVSPWAGLLLVGYIAFAILAVMNVVTGLFVENAMERAKEVRDLQVVSRARKVFESLDQDTSGSISLVELEAHIHTQSVQDYFQAIDIHPSEARILFEMLDQDGSGEIDFQEFIEGCLRLQGPARAVDLLVSAGETRRSFGKTLYCLKSLAAATGVPMMKGGSSPELGRLIAGV